MARRNATTSNFLVLSSKRFFSEKFNRDDLSNQKIVDVYYSKKNWGKYDRVQELASKKNVLSVQLSLAYVLNQNFLTAAVIGSGKLEHGNSSVEGEKISLTSEELDYLNLIIT
ncbi:aldo/keto reductase [Enterococcus aquimarinus]|uniref:aldo/keto reductase n=1 Tax=Enterococcus aquimarinus TaxID=328396 RepID=UPI002481EE86|nr:aldo/keto reductase [Enterococcus aquimarinus]